MSDNKSPDDLRSLYRAIKQERQRRIDEHKRNIAARIAPATNLNILADGDSWFSYPLSMDVIDFVRQDGNPSPLVLNLAVAGDPTTATLGVSKRQLIINTLSDPQHGNFDAMLFSGGGDDVAGDQFCLWLTQNVGSGNGVNNQAFSDILGVVETAYKDLFDVCGSIQPKCKIFIHSYDFARPTGVGVCPDPITGGYLVGPWLKPSLDYRGWTNFISASGVVATVLAQLDVLFVALENQYSPQVVYVRTQGTLVPPNSTNDTTSDWANELHPTDPGFEKIAQKFLDSLRLSFRGRI
jgi:hypothetical protein